MLRILGLFISLYILWFKLFKFILSGVKAQGLRFYEFIKLKIMESRH